MKYDQIKRNNIITISQGSDYQDSIIATHADGSPVDLTGYTATSQLRDMAGNLKATFTCTIPTPLTGAIHRTLTNSVTKLLTPSPSTQPTYVWGIELTFSTGTKLPELQGGAVVAIEVVYI